MTKAAIIPIGSQLPETSGSWGEGFNFIRRSSFVVSCPGSCAEKLQRAMPVGFLLIGVATNRTDGNYFLCASGSINGRRREIRRWKNLEWQNQYGYSLCDAGEEFYMSIMFNGDHVLIHRPDTNHWSVIR